MIDVKEATQIALSYFEDLYGEDAFSNVLLEEVEREDEDDTSHWLITIGFTQEKEIESSSPLSRLSPDKRRRYKRFKIDAQTGEVLSMKIRPVKNA